MVSNREKPPIFSQVIVYDFGTLREMQMDLGPLTILGGPGTPEKQKVLQAIYLCAECRAVDVGAGEEGPVDPNRVDITGQHPLRCIAKTSGANPDSVAGRIHVFQTDFLAGKTLTAGRGEEEDERLRGRLYSVYLILQGGLERPGSGRAFLQGLSPHPPTIPFGSWTRARRAVLLDRTYGASGDPGRRLPVLDDGKRRWVSDQLRVAYPAIQILTRPDPDYDSGPTVPIGDMVLPMGVLPFPVRHALWLLHCAAVLEEGILVWDVPEGTYDPGQFTRLVESVLMMMAVRPLMQVIIAVQDDSLIASLRELVPHYPDLFRSLRAADLVIEREVRIRAVERKL